MIHSDTFTKEWIQKKSISSTGGLSPIRHHCFLIITNPSPYNLVMKEEKNLTAVITLSTGILSQSKVWFKYAVA